MRSVHIIGVPLDLGGNRRGVDMGPSAFRIAGLGERLAALGYPIVDKGDLPAPIPETQELRDETKKYIRDIAKVCQKLYQEALASFEADYSGRSQWLARLAPTGEGANVVARVPARGERRRTLVLAAGVVDAWAAA